MIYRSLSTAPSHSSRPSAWRGLIGLPLAAALLSFSLPAPAPAQDPATDLDAPSALPSTAAPQLVKSIEVRAAGGAAVDRDRVLSNMSLKVGTAYSQEKSDADIKNLIASGVAANVSIIPEPSGDGVKLTVIVEPRTSLGEVVFLGNTSIPSRDLERAVELEKGSIVDDIKLQEAATKIREEYQRKGFPDVDIRYQQEKVAETGFTRVTFYITEGERALLNDIRFEGNTVFTARELKKLVEVGDRDWWRVWNLTKRINSEKLERDVAAIQAKYQDNGYMNARVTGIDRLPVGEKVDVVFRIFEGDKYDITAVAIEGMTTYPKEELLPSLALTAAEPYSAGSIKGDLKLIRDYYGARGYADVQVTPRISRSGPNQLAVTYAVAEGTRSYIRKINIDGNQKTRDEVIRRELVIFPGDEFSTTKIDVSQRRLQNIGFFETPERGGVEFFPVDTETPGYKDINITVREKATGQVQFGVGFSSIDSLIGIVELQQTNFDLWNWPSFTGAGQKFRTRIQYGDKRRDFGIEFTEPWFLGERLAFGTEFFYRELLYLSDYYDQTNLGGAISLTKPVGENSRLRGEYRLQNVTIDDIDEDASPEIRQEEGDYITSTFGLTYSYDTRDVLLGLTRKGHKLTFDAAVSGLGGDVETYDFGITGAKYFSLPFDTVFKLEGAVETIDNWGGDRVPIFQRKFLGGANNLRGFDYRDVGPKDENGEPIGGRTSTYITAEYNFPLFWNFRGVVFADLGMVSDSFTDWGGDWNSDVGLGLHLYNILPQGPIRVEVGLPISSDEENDNGARFNFNIGYQF
ncbi:MAG: outer membrane protein assembly factor BamA [Verrucomicrobiales bacterium]